MLLGEHAAGPVTGAVGVDAKNVASESVGVEGGDALEYQVGDDVGENPVADDADRGEVDGCVDVPVHNGDRDSIRGRVAQAEKRRG